MRESPPGICSDPLSTRGDTSFPVTSRETAAPCSSTRPSRSIAVYAPGHVDPGAGCPTVRLGTGPLLLTDVPKLIEAWGFEYATVAFVWDQKRTNPGYYTLSQAEFCVVAKRGRIPQPRGARNVRQWVDFPDVITEIRGKHSAKPAVVRARIAEMFPTQRKIELFARERVDGWDGWGKEYPDAT